MEILLVRHGQAVEEAPGLGDEGRWLTAKGRKLTKKVGRWLDESKKRRPTAIWTSPLVRAAQTAEILAAEVGLSGEVIASAELKPGRDPGDLLTRLREAKVEGVLALVGHEPSLSLIASALLGQSGVEPLKKSGVAAIAWSAGEGRGARRFVLDLARMKADKSVAAPAPEEPAAADLNRP